MLYFLAKNLKFFKFIVFIPLVMASISFGQQHPQTEPPSAELSDFSFALSPFQHMSAQRIGQHNQLAFGGTVLVEDWLNQISAAFERTSVGNAMAEENSSQDWQLVSVRAAPCAPLLPTISLETETLCWPELRLVWQPITNLNSNKSFYADDRAIHQLYDIVLPETIVGTHQNTQKSFFEKIKNSKLTQEEKNQFEIVKLRAQKYFAKKMMALRTSVSSKDDQINLDELAARKIIGERIEDNDRTSLKNFTQKLSTFLAEFAKPEQAKLVTAFSLPAGRQPALLDEWVFLKFQPRGKQLSQLPQFVESVSTGKRISPIMNFARATMRNEDVQIEDFLFENPLPTANPLLQELHDRTIFRNHNTKEIVERISNPHLTTTSNATCVSCHKLNNLRFDFHNFSYLEDRPLTIAPRVKEEALAELPVWRELLTASH